jgi:ATP-dependent DNA helicase DinG
MSWTEATAVLAANLPGYESRVEQTNLATEIENALADEANLLAQAGCGTGKSFAYLVALAFRARELRKPSVVSTATKALQAQLANKDLPFLAQNFPWLRFAVVKGRSNYICRAKATSEQAQSVPNLAEILTEVSEPGHTGDFDDLRTPIAAGDRSKLGVIADECPGKRDCPFGDVCFAEAAKANAQDAHVVVANHAVLLRDTEIKNLSDGKAGMLPNYGALAIDEAHELEEYATGALGVEFAQRGLERLGQDVALFLREKDADHELRAAARKLFVRLDEVIGKRNETLRLTDDLLIDIFDELGLVLKVTNELRDTLRQYEVEDDDRAAAQKRLDRRVKGMLARLSAVMLAESTEIVRWIEREKRVFKGQEEITTKLAYAPLHVGEYLASNLWEVTPSVLVSATLATDEGFGYIAERLGMDKVGYREFDAGSPFDFTRQATLYVPQPKIKGGTFPNEPKDSSWQGRMIAESGELIKAAGGRTLLLFTSRRSMNETHQALLPTLERLGVRVLRQGDMPNGQLSELFASDETSVLFALKSFMTGADFQGDTLRLVIIDKMPFGVPTDVIFAARAEAIDAASDGTWRTKSFVKLSIPIAVLTLLQAFGRGIRTRTDEAVIAIFDPRLISKGYGGGILRTLPPAARVTSLADAKAALVDMTARRG